MRRPGSSRRSPLLTVIGDLVEDIVVWTESMRRGTDNPASVHRSRGGSAANVAAVAAGLVPTRFVGRVGGDDAGRRLVAELRACGVDAVVQTGGTTGTVVVVVTPDGERTMFPDRAAAAGLQPIDPGWLAGTTLVHVPAYGFVDPATVTVLAAAAQAARATGAAVSVDLSAVSVVEALGRDALDDALGRLGASIVFANRDEAIAAGLEDRPPPGALVVVKDGPRPATLVEADGRRRKVDALEVDGVTDTTGAGDAFAAGFLAAWATGADPVTATVAGHRSAAAVLAHPGAATPRAHDATGGRPR